MDIRQRSRRTTCHRFCTRRRRRRSCQLSKCTHLDPKSHCQHWPRRAANRMMLRQDEDLADYFCLPQPVDVLFGIFPWSCLSKVDKYERLTKRACRRTRLMKPKRGNQRMALLWMDDGLRLTNTLSLCLAASSATQPVSGKPAPRSQLSLSSLPKWC